MSIVRVAKLAGVSHATVSRVINNRPGVSAESVQRVREAMDELRYVPAANRRGPKPKTSAGIRTGNIGLLLFSEAPTLASSPVTALATHAAQEELASRGFNLMIAQVASGTALPPSVAGGNVDGLLMHGMPPSEDIRRKLARYSACVWLLSQRRRQGYWGDRVSPDNAQVGALAARYLIDRGHERIAVVNCDPRHLGFATRTQSFEDAAREAGMPHITLGEGQALTGSEGSQYDALVEQLLSIEGARPTGLFVPRDQITIGMFRALRARGIQPGRDIDIISCDNTPALAGLDPRPATFDLRPDEIGRRAVEQLLWRIGNHNTPVNVSAMVEPMLVPGDASSFASSAALS